LVVAGEVIPDEAGDGLFVSLDAAAVGVVGVKQFVEGQLGHVARIVGAPLQTCDDLPLKSLGLVGGKGRMPEAIR
jgi:hypothetical protein